jgi:hypothetical protein
MGYRIHIVFSVCVALLTALAAKAQALTMTAHASGMTGVPASYVQKVACGWDYACPPEPGYGLAPTWRLPPQDRPFIQNNYGNVTIQVDGHRGPAAAANAQQPCCVEPPRAEAWLPRRCGPGASYCERDWERTKWLPPCGTEPCAEEKPIEDCGLKCWWRRVRDGYCGHGCWSYREQARIEAEAKEERRELKEEGKAEREAENEGRRDGYLPRYPQPYYYSPPHDRRPCYFGPGCPRGAARTFERPVPPRYEAPKVDERTPLGRFSGPKYP